jgi:hypothetical protein
MEPYSVFKRPVITLLRAVADRFRLLLNWALVPLLRHRVWPRSVLHVSYMVHIPYYTVRLLREHGYRADYLAIGRSSTWDKADYCFEGPRWRLLRPLFELWWFWTVMTRYEIIHLHFLITPSATCWELPVLKSLGRKIVAHYRGCEGRDREKNMVLHPSMNICQQCDYNPQVCNIPLNRIRRDAASHYADLRLVTTPDLLDFVPSALHFPFFSPLEETLPHRTTRRWPERGRFKIVHATNHPGIEGTEDILMVINRLRARGYPIDFVFLRGVSHDRVLGEYADADLSIGKMKMGYYANAQIESLACGVPAVTYVRPEFLTKEIQESGLILASLENLETVIADHIDHPEKLEQKSRAAKTSVGMLHDNGALTRRLVQFYESLNDRRCIAGVRGPTSSLDVSLSERH